MVAGDREGWLTTVDSILVAEFLSDWPGPSRVESAEEAWDVYHDFFSQFEQATYRYINLDTDGAFTTMDFRCDLVGRGSHTPVQVSWTVLIEFDSEGRKHRSHRWFHRRDEALAWLSTTSRGPRA